MQRFHSINLQHAAFVTFPFFVVFLSPLWLFCFLVACHNPPLTTWEASDPMRGVYWNIFMVQECTHKTANCFCYSYTGSQKARPVEEGFRVSRLMGRILKGQRCPHTWRSQRKAPGNVSQGTGAIWVSPSFLTWLVVTVRRAHGLPCPNCCGQCGLCSCCRDLPSPLGCQTPVAKLREMTVRRHLWKFQKNI